MIDKPVFIGGFRSGTTLLINLLGLHDEIAPWFETKFLCEALRWMRVVRRPGEEALETAYCVPPSPAGFTADAVAARMRADVEATFARLSGQQHSGKAAHERYPVGHDCVAYSRDEADQALRAWRNALAPEPDYATLGQATGDLIRDLAERQRQALQRPHWINKTPEISRFAPELRDSLGPCRIIYMVRNGLDVVASARGLGWGGVEQLAFNWQGLLRQTREGMQALPADYLELRYEDLLADPARELDRVLAFCGRAPEGADLVKRFTARAGEGAFDLSRLGRHRELSDDERAAFDAVAGELQAELGY